MSEFDDDDLIRSFQRSKDAFFSGDAAFSLRDTPSLANTPEDIKKLHHVNRKFRQMMETERAILDKTIRPLKRILAQEEHAKLLRYYAELGRILAQYYSKDYYSSTGAEDKYKDPDKALEILRNMANKPISRRALTYAEVKNFFDARAKKIKEVKKAQKAEDQKNNVVPKTVKDKLTGILQDTKDAMPITSIKKWAGITHVNRIYWTFFRLTLLTSLMETQIAGAQGVSEAICIPNEACNVASAGILYFRFLTHFYLMMSHLHFSLLLQGKDGLIAFKEEICDELDKRGENMLNDMVWGTVNLLTNFDGKNSVLGKVIDMGSTTISAINASPIPVASLVTAAFLVFDMAWNSYQLFYKDLPKYIMDKKRLRQELGDIISAVKNKIVSGGQIPPEKHQSDLRYLNDPRYTIAKAKLDEHEAAWAGKWYGHATCIAAACFLLTGFSASLFFTGGMAIPICYSIVLFGTAMYFCAESFGNLAAARKRENQNNSELKVFKTLFGTVDAEFKNLNVQLTALAQIDNDDMKQRELLAEQISGLVVTRENTVSRIQAVEDNLAEIKAARKEAVKQCAETIGRNLIMPGLILGVAAVCWQGALAIAVSYAIALLALKAYRWYRTAEDPNKNNAAIAPAGSPVLTRTDTMTWPLPFFSHVTASANANDDPLPSSDVKSIASGT